MPEEKQQVRNAEGKLLCEMDFDGKSWNMRIKRSGHYTSIYLNPDGSFHVFNDDDTDLHSAIVFG